MDMSHVTSHDSARLPDDRSCAKRNHPFRSVVAKTFSCLILIVEGVLRVHGPEEPASWALHQQYAAIVSECHYNGLSRSSAVTEHSDHW